jgi:enamine deaminase RidA (YjgF/YER057c/UK114 family)
MNDASEVRRHLEAAGLELPPAASALGDYVPAVRTGDLVFTSGQLPVRGGALVARGIVGDAVDVALARECASQAALNALAAASTVCGLDDVAQVVKVTGYVACAAGFTEQPAVVDGASAVMLAAFGEAGRHARAAVGVSALPLGTPVEIEIVLRLA